MHTHLKKQQHFNRRRWWLVKCYLAFSDCRHSGMYVENAILVYCPNIWWCEPPTPVGGQFRTLQFKGSRRMTSKPQKFNIAAYISLCTLTNVGFKFTWCWVYWLFRAIRITHLCSSETLLLWKESNWCRCWSTLTSCQNPSENVLAAIEMQWSRRGLAKHDDTKRGHNG